MATQLWERQVRRRRVAALVRAGYVSRVVRTLHVCMYSSIIVVVVIVTFPRLLISYTLECYSYACTAALLSYFFSGRTCSMQYRKATEGTFPIGGSHVRVSKTKGPIGFVRTLDVPGVPEKALREAVSPWNPWGVPM